MRFRDSLQVKILIYILSTVLLIFLLVGLYVGIRNSKVATVTAHEYTKLTAEKHANEVKAILNHYLGFAESGSKSLSAIAENNKKMTPEVAQGSLQSFLSAGDGIESAWLILSSGILDDTTLSSDSWVMYESKKLNNASVNKVDDQNYIDGYLAKYGQANAATISEVTDKDNVKVIEIYAPVLSGSGKVGVVGLTIDLNVIADYISTASVYDGETITVFSNSGIIVGNTNKTNIGKKYSQNFTKVDAANSVEKKIESGVEFSTESKKNSETYYSVITPVKISENIQPWAVQATVPMTKMLESSKKGIRSSIYVAIVGFLIIILVIYLIMKQIINPIKVVTNTLDLLSKGNLKDIETSALSTHDELQQMTENLNHVVSGLKKTESFALEIGSGNLDNEYSLIGEADQLGKALLEMRNSLKKNLLEDVKRKKEEEQIAWATNGIAKFGEILRQDNADMKKLGYNVISNLVNYLNVNQGALFVLNEENPEDQYFELATAIAFGRDKFMKKEIKIGEGLVGRCAYEKKTIFLKEVPSDYPSITSGLGDAKPGCILIVPCILNDAVFGVIEIASFTVLKPHEIEFVEKLGESIGATISSVRVNLKTATLLSASQHQSEELAAQEEELRQNLEEMEATQEDLKRQMDENLAMRENLTQQNALLDALLFSLPDLIYFKDKDSKFIRISQSMINIFGAETVDEIIGKSDFDFHTPENARKYFEDEKRIMETGEGITNQLQRETYADGKVIWNSVTKLPLLTSDGACIGTFGISKDVTDIKLLEEEAQKQTALLDAMLKWLPDYIYFKDLDSKFIRISESMLSLFGANNVEEVIGKSDFDYHTSGNAQKYYDDEQNIIKTRKGINNQIQKEITANGSVIWTSVTKLPLLTSSGECIGTFGISRDVTHIKNLELESNKQKIELTGIIDAITNSTFTVVYDRDGKIIDVNDALLKLLQLEKDKVIGMHHREGLDLSGLSDKDYKKFWDDILNGEMKSTENKIKINNKEIYFSETYSPIKDENEKVVKIMKIAFDITQYKKGRK